MSPGCSLPCLKLRLIVPAGKTRFSNPAPVPKTCRQSDARRVPLTVKACEAQGVPTRPPEVLQHLRKVEVAQITFPSPLPKLLPSLQCPWMGQTTNPSLAGAMGALCRNCFADLVLSSPPAP